MLPACCDTILRTIGEQKAAGSLYTHLHSGTNRVAHSLRTDRSAWRFGSYVDSQRRQTASASRIDDVAAELRRWSLQPAKPLADVAEPKSRGTSAELAQLTSRTAVATQVEEPAPLAKVEEPAAAEQDDEDARRHRRRSNSVCEALADAAVAQGLPIGFFARLIWQESRFDQWARSPVGRPGRRAVHAADGRRVRLARSVRSDRERCGVGAFPAPAARPVRQPRPCRCRLQRRRRPDQEVAQRTVRHAGGNPELCQHHHRASAAALDGAEAAGDQLRASAPGAMRRRRRPVARSRHGAAPCAADRAGGRTDRGGGGRASGAKIAAARAARNKRYAAAKAAKGRKLAVIKAAAKTRSRSALRMARGA